MNFINWGLISNPANWLVVFLMLAIAALGLTAILGALNTPTR